MLEWEALTVISGKLIFRGRRITKPCDGAIAWFSSNLSVQRMLIAARAEGRYTLHKSLRLPNEP